MSVVIEQLKQRKHSSGGVGRVARVLGPVVGDQLDRDRPVEPRVARAVDDRHPAAPELALDLVLMADGDDGALVKRLVSRLAHARHPAGDWRSHVGKRDGAGKVCGEDGYGMAIIGWRGGRTRAAILPPARRTRQ